MSSSEPSELEQHHDNQSLTRRDVIALLVIVSTAVILVLPIFLKGFPSGADIRHHYKWAYFFCDGLREGSLYPRWLAGINRGYGSPVMFYYPPFEFYVVAAFNAIAGNLLLAIKLSCSLAMIASGVSMYVFSRTMLSRSFSVAAAVLYMAAPYHIFQLYRVNALAEYWALVWIPLVLDAITRIARGGGWRASAYLALCYALLLLTHIPSSLIVTATVMVYLLAITRDRRKLGQALAGGALGIGISAFFLVSVLFETKYVRIDRILENTYVKAFLFEDFSAWSWNNLLSTADYPNVAGYVREANLVSSSLVLLLIVVSVVLLIERRPAREDGSHASIVRAIWLVAIVSLLMTTRLTIPLWNTFRNLQYLQSPVRWLVPATLATALLTAIAIRAAAGARRRVVLAVSLGLAIAASLVVGAHVSTQRPVDPEGLENKLLRQDVPEYRPLWWDGLFREEFERTSIVVAEGDVDVRVIDDAGLKQVYEISARTDATLKLRSVWFPGWVTRVDGVRVEMGRSNEGNIQLGVPPGDHRVTLEFEESSRHIKANVVSAASLLMLAAIFYSTRRARKKRETANPEPNQ